jgi:8-amino-7-oxononanoate synthase
VHTFGKALACSGGKPTHSLPFFSSNAASSSETAVVICDPLVRSFLINYARPLIYSTVMPRMNVAAINCSLDVLESGASEPVSPGNFFS